jgi:AraC family transcriptional regulator
MSEFFGRVVGAAAWAPFRISETRYARGAFLPRHRHEESYLTFVLAGGYRERSADGTRACEERSLVFHPAGDTHEDDFAERPTRCLNVIVTKAFVARLGSAAAPLDRGDVVAGVDVAGIASRLAAEMRVADAAAELIVEGLLLELFGTVARGARDERRTPLWLAEAHAILGRRFGEKIGLAEIAAEVGVHPTHFARAFRRRYSVSVGEHVRALRLEWARGEIARGIPLAAVAAQAGFADQSHFTKAFAKATGVTPSAYRRRLRA